MHPGNLNGSWTWGKGGGGRDKGGGVQISFSNLALFVFESAVILPSGCYNLKPLVGHVASRPSESVAPSPLVCDVKLEGSSWGYRWFSSWSPLVQALAREAKDPGAVNEGGIF
jgi:hypothetical protein